MALAAKAKFFLKHALGSKEALDEVQLRLDGAANVAALGTTTDLVGVDGSGDNAAPLVGTEARLDAIEAKIDALLAALIAAGLMEAE